MTLLMRHDITHPITSSLKQVVEVFDEELQSDLPFVKELEQQVRRYRGKLLRPTLLLLTAEATGTIQREHTILAAVVEMIHMATLVHDDVLDEADTRRHHATVNRLVGNEGAVLFGDYLISHAYHLCSSLRSTHASRRISAVTNTVCEGELMQIANRGNLDLSEKEYLEIIRRKTAALTSVCCELGASVSNADKDVVEQTAMFGEDLGVAFQIVDDLLDLTATENETGKTVGRDADLGKMTLPAIHFMDQACDRERERMVAALTSDEESKTSLVRTILNGSDAVEYAMNMAKTYVRSAVARLDILPDGEEKDGLITAAEFSIRRRT